MSIDVIKEKENENCTATVCCTDTGTENQHVDDNSGRVTQQGTRDHVLRNKAAIETAILGCCRGFEKNPSLPTQVLVAKTMKWAGSTSRQFSAISSRGARRNDCQWYCGFWFCLRMHSLPLRFPNVGINTHGRLNATQPAFPRLRYFDLSIDVHRRLQGNTVGSEGRVAESSITTL
jgi:hypothetical protein